MSVPVLPPGGTIGILGGGQLGRMLAGAAARLGLKCAIYCPEAGSPAFDVAVRHVVAAYEDEAALADFAASVDVVTYEFENVPAATAEFIAARVPLAPGARALAVTQDRLAEKQFAAGLGIEVAPFAPVDTLVELEAAVARLGRPSILKTRRFGYDGKGQVVIRAETDLAAAFAAIGGQPAILEGFVPFVREVSVLVARGRDGRVVPFDLTENVHRNQILHVSTVPAEVSPATAAAALVIGEKLAGALDYIGVLAVELFVVGEGAAERLVVNEMAPRVHNSGHWTLDGANISQFEQHIRAVAGWPLGQPIRHGRVSMTNLIGDEIHDWARFAAEPGSTFHHYGKAEARPGRKMGHVTRLHGPAD